MHLEGLAVADAQLRHGVGLLTTHDRVTINPTYSEHSGLENLFSGPCVESTQLELWQRPLVRVS